jgi:hypothetical protein
MIKFNAFIISLQFLLALSLGSVYAQKTLCKIPFNKRIDEIQTYSWGDSLLLSVKQDNMMRSVHTYWIDKVGNFTKSNIVTTDSLDDFVTGIIRVGADYYTYSLGGSGQKTTVYVRKNGVEGSRKKVELEGRAFTAFEKGKAFIVATYSKKENFLRVFQIENYEIASKKEFLLPIDLSQYKANQIQFVQSNSLFMLSESTAKLKLHVDDQKLTIVADNPFEQWFVQTGVTPMTSILTLDLNTGHVDVRTVLESSRDDFRSFYFEGILYRTISTSLKFDLQVIDGTGNIVNRFMMPRSEAAKKQQVFFREGRENEVSIDETLYRMMSTSNSTKPGLHVERNSEGKVIITWATYFDSNGGGVMSGPTPAAALLTFFISTAVRQMREGPGVSRYFYLVEDGVGGFKYTIDEPTIARRQIDMFEMTNLTKEKECKYKGYTKLGTDVMGVYFNAGEGVVELVNYGELY